LLSFVGTEFTSLKKYFADKNVLLTFKFGANKANFSEYSIYLVKSRLYKLLRSKLSDDWPKYIKYVVDALNQRQLRRIGFLTPASITEIGDNLKIQAALKEHNIELYEEPSWQEQTKNQKAFEASNKNLKVGDFVYLDKKQSIFDKSFYYQVV